MTDKEKLIEIFLNNIKGKSFNVNYSDYIHDGQKGYWLEEQFGIRHNSKNEADLYGYELKSETSTKTTFGDWSANEYIFNQLEYNSIFNESSSLGKRDHFLRLFGKSNILKNGRYSWSGESCPKINEYNKFGQILKVIDNNDIIAEYSYSKDLRNDKEEILPPIFQQDNLILAKWYGDFIPNGKTGKCLRERVENKFNDKGWFTCKTNSNGIYDTICFGSPITFENWINLVKSGIVFFDSGMHETNPRPYSNWRALNNLWNSLIVEIYS